jgi:hypothetical protein
MAAPKMGLTNGINIAAGYPNWWSSDVQQIVGSKMDSLIMWAFTRFSPLSLIANITSDVDMCGTTYTICDDASNIGTVQGLAIDGVLKPDRLKPPKIIARNGFRQDGMSLKVPKQIMDCISADPMLRRWFDGVLQSRLVNIQRKIFARAYIELTNKVDGRNTGHNAGLEAGGIDLGTPDRPLTLTPDNIDTFVSQLIEVKGQMPETNILGHQLFGPGDCGLFAIMPPAMEQLFRQAPIYNDYYKIGDCNPCSYFTDTFDRKPGGITFIKNHCLNPVVCTDGSNAGKTAWPILFGCRYAGIEFKFNIENVYSEVKEGGSMSLFYDTIATSTPLNVLYPCFLGMAWVVLSPNKLTGEVMCPDGP